MNDTRKTHIIVNCKINAFIAPVNILKTPPLKKVSWLPCPATYETLKT